MKMASRVTVKAATGKAAASDTRHQWGAPMPGTARGMQVLAPALAATAAVVYSLTPLLRWLAVSAHSLFGYQTP